MTTYLMKYSVKIFKALPATEINTFGTPRVVLTKP